MDTQSQDYFKWLVSLKSAIKNRQIKAAIAVNSNLILMYWDLGKEIVEKQENAKWGSGFINQLSKDLKIEFPDVGGFSSYNLRFCKTFFQFYRLKPFWEQVVPESENAANEIQEQVVPEFQKNIFKIPWGHHILILKKIKNQKEALFYINQTIENNWSRAILEYQIETNLFSRQGNAITNFKNTLPSVQGDLARELLKDPYNFEFLSLSAHAQEKDLEQKLVQHISQFLLELGKGFAYLGRQFQLKVGTKEYRTDLLFYHTKLKCYIIIELKLKEFEPEFIGKLNFYITAVNEIVKGESDYPTIGILLCKNKDNFEVEFALKDVNKPIGVSEFNYTQLPENIKKALPTLEEFENELRRIEHLE